MKQVLELKQRGFSLLELGIILSIVGIGSALFFNQMRATNTNSRAQTVSRDLQQIITNVQRLYSTKTGFPEGSMENRTLINNNIFPATWIDSSGNLTTPFKGRFRIDVERGVTGTAAIVIDNIPSKVCAELGQLMAADVAGMWVGAGGSAAVYFVKIASAAPAQGLSPGEINLDNLGRGCSADYAEMAIYFYRY